MTQQHQQPDTRNQNVRALILRALERAQLEHFQEKWKPVFRPKMRQARETRAHSVSVETECALDEKPAGTFVVVNIATGEYVVAESFMDANSAFMERFPGAGGFAHRLGEPLFEPLLLD